MVWPAAHCVGGTRTPRNPPSCALAALTNALTLHTHASHVPLCSTDAAARLHHQTPLESNGHHLHHAPPSPNAAARPARAGSPTSPPGPPHAAAAAIAAAALGNGRAGSPPAPGAALALKDSMVDGLVMGPGAAKGAQNAAAAGSAPQPPSPSPQQQQLARSATAVRAPPPGSAGSVIKRRVRTSATTAAAAGAAAAAAVAAVASEGAAKGAAAAGGKAGAKGAAKTQQVRRSLLFPFPSACACYSRRSLSSGSSSPRLHGASAPACSSAIATHARARPLRASQVFGAQYPPGYVPPPNAFGGGGSGGNEPMLAWIKTMSDSIDAMTEGFKGALGIKPEEAAAAAAAAAAAGVVVGAAGAEAGRRQGSADGSGTAIMMATLGGGGGTGERGRTPSPPPSATGSGSGPSGSRKKPPVAPPPGVGARSGKDGAALSHLSEVRLTEERACARACAMLAKP